MALPRIFQWPTPWFWGAILLLMLFANRNVHIGIHFVECVALVGAIVIAASIVYAIREKRSTKIKAAEPEDALSERLAKIESRLTDTQDVMIALSEKMDRMEEVEVSGNKEASQP